MPFAPELSPDQIADLREDVYWATLNVAYCPSTILFQALTNQVIAQGVFAEFAYDNVTVGAYTDIKENMVVFLSTTTNIRFPLWVGRIRELPTSTVLKINEAAIVLQEDWIVTVIDDRRLFEKLSRVAADGTIYMDWNIPYAPPAPLIYNLQSAYVNPVRTGSASFDFAPLANAIADTATITGWLWDVADGTITGGGVDTDQDITAEFPQGFRWVRVTATSSNGETNFLDFPVWVGTQYTIENVIMPQITCDEAGYNATIQGYHTDATTVLRTLLDKTLVCLYSTEYLSPTIVSNVDMVGRFVNEDGGGRGDEKFSDVQEVNFQIQGIGAQLAALSVSRFRLEDSSTPSVWGQVVKPTPTRTTAHMAARLSTLSQICSVQVNPDNDVFISKSLQNEETSSGAGMARQAEFIHARLNYAPTGEIRIERDAFYDLNSASLETVMDFDWNEGDILEFSIRREYQETAGQVKAGAERYTRSTGATKYLTASAPPVAQGQGEFSDSLDGLLLEEGSDDSASITEINEAAGTFLAVSQPLVRMKARFFDCWRNILIPNCFQWYTFNLPAISNPRGLVFTNAQRWLLESISRDVDTETGRNVTVGEFIAEPTSGAAQVLGAVIPDAVVPALPSIPVIDAYPAFPPNPVINYPNDNPGELDLQPVDIGSGYQGYSPLPQDAAQDAANNAGNPGCQTYNVFFSDAVGITGFTTGLGDDYIITLRGSARISSGQVTKVFRLVDSIPAGVIINTGLWVAGVGVKGILSDYPNLVDGNVDAASRVALSVDLGQSYFVNAIRVYTFIDAPNTGDGGVSDVFIPGSVGVQSNLAQGQHTFTFAIGASISTFDAIFDLGYTTAGNFAPYTPNDVRVPRIEVDVQGSGEVEGDAFYHSFNTAAGGLAQAYGAEQGIRFNNTAVDPIPAYNPQHVYGLNYVGDGNPFLARFANTDYSETQNVPLVTEICGPGAGSYRR